MKKVWKHNKWKKHKKQWADSITQHVLECTDRKTPNIDPQEDVMCGVFFLNTVS